MPLLRLEHVEKSFGAVRVADGLSFELDAGEALGVIGPNGAGKSSVFNLIGGNLRPNSGRILLDGVDISGQPPHARCRAGIGRSYQIPQPFSSMTVFENLLVPASFAARGVAQAERSLCREVLSQTGLLAKANTLAGTLTLLERKRLELARALASKPRLLLLDEIAGGLTEHEATALVGTIRDIRRSGVAIIWIEHIVHALTAVVDRLLVMNFGAKLADGDPASVMASAEVKRIYLGVA